MRRLSAKPPVGVAAVILGHLAQRKQPYARGYWITGLITGYITIALSLLTVVFFIVIFAVIPDDYSSVSNAFGF